MKGKLARPSPALIVAVIALFVALGGTAGAVVTAAVPLAKVALTANNAKKLNGQTSAQIISRAAAQGSTAPGPASTAAGVVSVKTGTNALAAGAEGEFTVACDAGQKVAGGGFSTDGAVLTFDSHPSNDSTWRLYLVNLNTGAVANLTLYATCIR